MSIPLLSAARIAGEVGLAGGTIIGGTYAAKYSNGVTKLNEKVTALTEDNKQLEGKIDKTNEEAEEIIKAYYMMGKYLFKEERPGIKDIESEFLPFYSCSYNHTSSLRRESENRCSTEKITKLEDKLKEKGVNSI